MSSGELLGVFVFGSYGRDDADRSSDLDVLAVVRDGKGRVPRWKVAEHIPSEFSHLEPEISWYGLERITEMYAAGELFAWHISQDARALHDPSGLLDQLGTPAPYRAALDDIRSFASILSGVRRNVLEAPWNAVYEAGLIYICARNIAMSASAVLLECPDFSRNSPTTISSLLPFPLSKATYENLMKCRLAGQRGLPVPQFNDVREVIALQEAVAGWADRLIDNLSMEFVDER